MPFRGKGRELSLLFVAVLVALLGVEILVRGAVSASKGPGYAPVNTATNSRAHGPTNTQGYRDFERARSKRVGERRVVALGDSFTWGASVEFDDAWPQRVERALNREHGGGFEVVNLALPGFKTVDQADVLSKSGFGYAPDAVVVAYVLNDSEDENAAETRRAARWQQEKRDAAPPALLDRSALVRFVRGRWRATVENRARIAGYRSMYADEAGGWVAGRQALRTIGAACRERGVPWVVAIFPLFGNPLDERYPFAEIHAKVGAAAAEAGARVVDLWPEYRTVRPDILVVDGADDEHPSEIGHRVASRAIVRALSEVLALRSTRLARERAGR